MGVVAELGPQGHLLPAAQLHSFTAAENKFITMNQKMRSGAYKERVVRNGGHPRPFHPAKSEEQEWQIGRLAENSISRIKKKVKASNLWTNFQHKLDQHTGRTPPRNPKLKLKRPMFR